MAMAGKHQGRDAAGKLAWVCGYLRKSLAAGSTMRPGFENHEAMGHPILGWCMGSANLSQPPVAHS